MKVPFRTRLAAITLAVAVAADGTLPNEFRLFVSGWNDTEKGAFLFDDRAAAATMAAYVAWGVDQMIDLEHQSLNPNTPPEPTARDARGWYRLELRDDGSLWAIGVSWTLDGATRLREKRQRYVSPAFDVDADGRVIKVVNVAITALPATHSTPALVAARATSSARDMRKKKLSAGPAFQDVQCALAAAIRERFPSADGGDCSPSGPWIVDVFDATVVYELEGKLFELPYTFDGATATLGATATEVKRAYAPVGAPPPAPAAANPPAAAPAPAPAPTPVTNAHRSPATRKLAAPAGEIMDSWKKAALDAIEAGDGAKALEVLKTLLSEGDGPESTPAGGDPTADPTAAAVPAAPAATDDQKKKNEQQMAAARVLIQLANKSDPAEATTEITRLVGIARDLEKREIQLAADRAALDETERRKLVGQLVVLGIELPATAWSDEKGTVPVKRLADEPIAELRARVKLHAGTPRGAGGFVPPAGAGLEVGSKDFVTVHGTVTLSASELAECEHAKAKPEVYAANKAERIKARGGK